MTPIYRSIETAINAIIEAVQQSTSSASHAEQKLCPNIHRSLSNSRTDENGNTDKPKGLNRKKKKLKVNSKFLSYQVKHQQ